jgi:3'(2'), 5'-bisphosphate nucleotidase
MDLREAAKEAVLQASRLCSKIQSELTADGAIEKGDRSPVTVADFCSQAVISNHLFRYHPNVPLLAEEDVAEFKSSATIEEQVRAYVSINVESALARCTQDLPDESTYWTLDPIDGTKGFMRGDQYAVSLALIEHGEVVLGLLGCPNFEGGILLIAEKGKGVVRCTLTEPDVEIPVPLVASIPMSDARTCESVEAAHTSHGKSASISERLGITLPPLRIDSQVKYAAVALGVASIYLRIPSTKGYEEKVWDHAAGMLVVQEAGGTVTDVQGKALDFSFGATLSQNSGVIATAGVDHSAVLPKS